MEKQQAHSLRLLCSGADLVNKDVLLPIPSNQKMNACLKEIPDRCSITKKMTFHMARHTFATSVTSTNGVPIETACRMLEQRNLELTHHGARMLH